MEKGFNKLKGGILIESRFNAEDAAQLSRCCRSRVVTLRLLKVKNLDFLLELEELEDLRLYTCTIDDCRALHQLKKLRSLFINGVSRANDNFSFLSGIGPLEDLSVGYAPHFVRFPDLSSCRGLTQLKLFNCKVLTDISNVVKIPCLERFSIVATPQKPKDLEFIMQRPTMKFMSGAFGGKKVDDEFMNLLAKHGIQYG